MSIAAVAPRVGTPAPPAARDGALDRLRTALTLLVVAHHACLAYTGFARFTPEFYLGSTAPVVDERRWAGFDPLQNFNDVFFMAWMFLLSGLFVWSSIRRHGARAHARDRLRRLGIPFVLGALLLVPLFYYPSQRLGAAPVGYAAFWRQVLLQDGWPSGPLWFLWMLLAFDLVVTAAAPVVAQLAETTGPILRGWAAAPSRGALALVGISAVGYLPVALVVDSGRWLSLGGPLWLQLSRPGLYFTYFFAGVLIGAAGLAQGPLGPAAPLARRWATWVAAAAGVYLLLLALPTAIDGVHPLAVRALRRLVFLASCACSGAACVALVRRFGGPASRAWTALQRDAYGIYLVHYAPVVWLQWWLLPAAMPAAVKFLVVFLGAVATSWLAAALLRRLPVLRTIL